MSRTAELVLGLIGSIVGLVAGFWIIAYGNDVTDYIQTFTYLNGALGDSIATLGWITVIASALALIATLLIKKKPTWLGRRTHTYRYHYVLCSGSNLDCIWNFNHSCRVNGAFPSTIA